MAQLWNVRRHCALMKVTILIILLFGCYLIDFLMRLECERHIPAFKGKNWRERWVLRNQAENRDPWILRLKVFRVILIYMPTFTLVFCLGQRFFPNQLWQVYFGFLVLLLPLDMLFFSRYIIPRIRKALESNTQPTA